MKASLKLSGLFIALTLITSCSKDERSFDSELLQNSDLNRSDVVLQDIHERYIVVFRDIISNPSAEAGMLGNRFGLEVGHIYEHVFKGFSARIPDQALNGLRNHPLIDYIEPDIEMHASEQIIPTGIRRIAVNENTTAAIDGVEGTITDPDGKSVDVAIIDTGIDKEHPDLLVKGGVRFYLSRLTDSNYDDDNGHGSHVAGTVGARDNGIGVVGVAPGAGLYAVKVLNSRGSGYLSDIIKGLDWVRDRAGEIEVINMSLGGQGVSSSYHTAIKNCVAAGIVVVVAAGNESRDVYGSDGTFGTSDDIIPAAYPEAAAISALADSDGEYGGLGSSTNYGSDDSFASFSNYSRSVVPGNPVTSPGAAIDLILPGVNILSCYKDMNYATMSGTSMASPHGAGLAALYIAKNGRASDAAGVKTIRQALINAGKDQSATEGLKVRNDPDLNKEKLGWAGAGSTSVNRPPVADFTYVATGLSVSFTNASSDIDGTITTYSWDFGDGSSSSLTNPSHTYAKAGTYSVKLTVTDDDGATNLAPKSVTVSSGTDPVALTLTATTEPVNKNIQKVTLTWYPAATVVDVYRDGVIIATSVTSPYTNSIKSGEYVYKVCPSEGICSNVASVNFLRSE